MYLSDFSFAIVWSSSGLKLIVIILKSFPRLKDERLLVTSKTPFKANVHTLGQLK